MTPKPYRVVLTPGTLLLVALASARLTFAQSTAIAPAKLVVKNAFILTMAKGQREPVKGYLLVGEDGSADVLGVADRLGSLEPGKLADFLVIDPTRFRTVFDPYASLVFVANERDLERVYVGGDLLVQNGAS